MENSVELSDRSLLVGGRTLLSEIAPNVTISPATTTSGAFIGASASQADSAHTFDLGTLTATRFVSSFRFKLWWQCQRIADSGDHVAAETQFLLLELKADDSNGSLNKKPSYAVILPIVEGPFRACLQGGGNNRLQLVVESGSTVVTKSTFKAIAYAGSDSDPYVAIEKSVEAVREHLQTFQTRTQKKIPGMLSHFGWCTWDAFYTQVNAAGIEQGLKSLHEAGAPPGFLIIDDGWQSVAADGEDTLQLDPKLGTQSSTRLVRIQENGKFQREAGDAAGDPARPESLKAFIHKLKAELGVKKVLMWHALGGYWGGVRPGLYGSTLQAPVVTAGVRCNQPDAALEDMKAYAVGVMDPAQVGQYFSDQHAYLAAAGADGVKVDVQSAVETVGQAFGGRVAIQVAYQKGFSDSVAAHFPDNDAISCMSHGNDAMFHTRTINSVRASDDFWPRDPASHTIHVASCAYNSLFMGELFVVDWDMFQSRHPMAFYHAAARAVGGCAVYVSDHPGEHDPAVLRKLVLPDGRVLRALLPGRPTLDCLFADPCRDQKTPLKIWNVNATTAVVGAFNCQGAGWSETAKVQLVHDAAPGPVAGGVAGADIPGLEQLAGEHWTGDVVIFSHTAGSLARVDATHSQSFVLPAKEFEVFTIAPVQRLNGTDFAAIGLTDMFNSGGAIQKVAPSGTSSVDLTLIGGGSFGAYSSAEPRVCTLDGEGLPFSYDKSIYKLAVTVPNRPGSSTLRLEF
ncbi:alkaline alpha galactosidase [Klebsormidium nitens]|uniref:galactinol--sucrose galactosyltransferase n=1 Tax=Klebsormidium nitens TaxID=105231 RepID=A0A1Y1ICG2_KLENI|nr:alkaline alpha galactosidase [Klebsormidium nitens]|eukprot:GAQ87662.1 alkaline alpha galactosidase [Klebsormidium nitens]